jgi:tol-pal system protein YbgF
VAGLLAACATEGQVDQKTQAVRAEFTAKAGKIDGKIGELDKAIRQAHEQQAKLEQLQQQYRAELSTAQQRNAELETRVQEIKGQDLSVLQGQLETIRRDLDGLQSGLDDQRAQVFALNQKLTGKLDEQASRLQAQGKSLEEQVARVQGRVEALDKRDAAALTALGKTVDERLDAQDRRLEGHEKHAEATEKDLAQIGEVVRRIGAEFDTQLKQQGQSLGKLEETMKQADVQVRTLTAEVNKFQGVLSEFSRTFHILNDKSAEIDRRMAELAGKTEGKVGTLVVQEAERAAKVEALRKQIEADGHAMLAQVRELRAQADRQAAGLDALEKKINEVVASGNETSRGLGELKRVMEESVLRPAAPPDMPQDARTQHDQPAERTAIPAEPLRPFGSASRAAPEAALSDKEAYERAQNQFGKGQYDIALTSFKLFLIQYPGSSLAPNAHFWMAECYFRTRDYERGIEEYEQVIKNYPKSEKASRALYRKAMAFLELNDKDAAKTALRQLIADYPKSEDSKQARLKLASLK